MAIIINITCIHTYHSRFIPEGVAEVSQIRSRHPRFTKTTTSFEPPVAAVSGTFAPSLTINVYNLLQRDDVTNQDFNYHYNEPINVLTTGAQTFLMDHT
jgi:hypothetical protein